MCTKERALDTPREQFEVHHSFSSRELVFLTSRCNRIIQCFEPWWTGLFMFAFLTKQTPLISTCCFPVWHVEFRIVQGRYYISPPSSENDMINYLITINYLGLDVAVCCSQEIYRVLITLERWQLQGCRKSRLFQCILRCWLHRIFQKAKMESCCSFQLHLQRVKTSSGSKHSKSWFFTCCTWHATRRNAHRSKFHAVQWHDASIVQNELNLFATSFQLQRFETLQLIAWCFSIHRLCLHDEGNSWQQHFLETPVVQTGSRAQGLVCRVIHCSSAVSQVFCIFFLSFCRLPWPRENRWIMLDPGCVFVFLRDNM